MHWSAKPVCAGSIPALASNSFKINELEPIGLSVILISVNWNVNTFAHIRQGLQMKKRGEKQA